MNQENWQKVKSLLDDALKLDANKREQFLDNACGDDLNLRREIEELLNSSENVKSFMEKPAVGEVAEAIVNQEDKLTSGQSFGHYKIIEQLGKGGMGEVYLAEDTKLGRRVALKLLPAHTIASADNLRRFEQEARAASRLNHPNIAHIYEIGESDNLHYIAMEYVEGESLSEKIAGRPLPISEIASIGAQIADALDEAHSKGITHRDIKSDNVMLDQRGRVKVLDFGLAKISQKSDAVNSEAATQVKTNLGVVMGTVSYMSPEQSLGRETDARTDIWSLGVVLYEMATGKLPFTANSITETIDKITHSQPEAIARFNYDVPLELEVIIKKAIRKKREERYQTARDILVDLQSLARELDVTEHSVAPNLRDTSGENSIKTYTDEQATKTLIQRQTVDTFAPIHSTSSAEYIATEIKQHKRGFVAGLVILLLASIGLGYWFFANRSANLLNIESIAVLPFVNESGNADNEYLSDGMTETLISSLSQLPRLSVKARSSVFRYKGKEINPQTIGKELNVQAILNGRVLQRDDQLTLRLELVDARNENVIWSEQYNRKQTDLVSLQTEIARDVSNKLKTKLSGTDEKKLSKNYTENTEAYQLYLKGRYHWNKRTGADVRKSVEYFQQAIDKDPTYALAYAVLAEAYILIPNYTNTPPHDAFPKARAAAEKALEIDETLAEAHNALADILYEYDWKFAEAEREFKRAIELNPNYATARHWYAEYLLVLGRNEEAIAEVKRAQELDPLSLIINSMVGPV
ncbi:MAG: protein kinase [Acidobacteria bacterium]|nr:protein kinase [Acidobacteriota bacterium]